MFDIDVLKSWLSSIIRIGLASVWTWMVSHGYMSQDQTAQAIAILAGIAAVLVSALIGKIWTQKKIDTALKLPANTSKETLKDVIANQ